MFSSKAGVLLIALGVAGCSPEPPPALHAWSEHALVLDPEFSDRSVPQNQYVVNGFAGPVANASAGSGPPYPIVLVHGFFGWDNIGPLDYFYKVKPTLEAEGHVVVVATLDPFNTTYVRGAHLLQQVADALASTGAAKVNLVAHSQGGLDARLVANVMPERVASVVTISAPHRGARIADVLLDKVPGFTVRLAKSFFKALARPVYGAVAKDADLEACLKFLTTDSTAKFNASYPDDPRVAYYSIAGRSGSAVAPEACLAPGAPPFITKYATHKDPVDPLLFLTHRVVGQSLLSPNANDGLVEVQSARWGTWLGCIPADHWDEVGQVLGDSPGPGNPFDHKTFYRELAGFLVSKGF